MSLVLDASMTLSWIFEDEQTPERMLILDRVSERGAFVPPVWPFEVANSLLIASRRGRIDNAFIYMAIEQLRALPIMLDVQGENTAWAETLDLARKHRLTVYDAAYLELARRRHIALASLDDALNRASRAEGLDLAGT